MSDLTSTLNQILPLIPKQESALLLDLTELRNRSIGAHPKGMPFLRIRGASILLNRLFFTSERLEWAYPILAIWSDQPESEVIAAVNQQSPAPLLADANDAKFLRPINEAVSFGRNR
jgi:hypothetical protein